MLVPTRLLLSWWNPPRNLGLWKAAPQPPSDGGKRYGPATSPDMDWGLILLPLVTSALPGLCPALPEVVPGRTEQGTEVTQNHSITEC